MKQYKHDGFLFNCNSDSGLDELLRATKDAGENLLVFQNTSTKNDLIVIDLDKGSYDIYLKSKKVFNYQGKLDGGMGVRMIIDINASTKLRESENKSLSQKVRDKIIERQKMKDEDVIKKFESNIPDRLKRDYVDVINFIDANNFSRKYELIVNVEELIGPFEVASDNWFNIIDGFKSKVMSEESTKHEFSRNCFGLRKVFAKFIANSVESNARQGNAMRRAVEEHDSEFWLNYARKKQEGS